MTRLFCIGAVLLFAFAFCYAKPLSIGRKDFPDPLDIRAEITNPKDVNLSFFSDMGAWHAYALPKRKQDFGGFVGPLVMDLNGRWLSKSISKLRISADGEWIDLSAAKRTATYYPGMLRETLEIAGLKIVQELIFVSNREALIRSSFTNLLKTKRTFITSFSGSLLLDGAVAGHKNHDITVRIKGKQMQYEIAFGGDVLPDGGVVMDRQVSTNHSISLNPLESKSILQTHRFYLTKQETAAKRKTWDFDKELKMYEACWNGYLDKYFGSVKLQHPKKQRLAVKAIVTLQTNWRSAAKDLKHDGVFPSSSYQGFYGFWSWDSWKHSVALARFNPKLAEESILSMFDYQDKHGMVADCIYTDKSENNWRDTKPPLAAWAVWELNKATGNKEFVRQIYPKLVKYHKWWYKNRDQNKNGLAEYGSTDGTKKAAGWESGMDNAVRFDNAKMVKSNATAWSFDQESVDLNAYLYAEKKYLHALALFLNKNAEAAVLFNESQNLRVRLNRKFYSKKFGYYYDYSTSGNHLVEIEGTEGWIPMWANAATKSQARAVVSKMMNRAKFNTKVPLPTFTADHKKFDPLDGYWRGPVWLDQFYFGVEGMRRYGFDKEADELTAKLFKNAEGLMADGEIRENYHPITGKGLNAKNFSWSAAHILMMLKNPPEKP
jgi:putative isomerase